MLLNTMGHGECFGEYSMLDDMPASASVVATEAGKALRIDQARFKNFLASEDRIGRLVYRNMLKLLVERLKLREGARDLPLLVR
jgi:CRP-like cAMP-binding protein